MHRWVSLSSSVRRTLARFACCSTASSPSSSAIRGSSSRIAPTSSEWSASWWNGAVASWQAPSPRSTASSSGLPTRTSRGDECSGRRSGQSCCGGSSSVARPARLGSRATRTRWAGRSQSSTARSSPGGRRWAARHALRRVPPGARPSRGVGSWRASPPRDRASHRRARCLGRSAGLRPRLRRSHRSRVAAARGTLRSHRRHVSLPYEPGRAVYASLSRTVDDLARLADGDVVELPPSSSEFLPPALAHIERELFAESPSRSPLDSSVRFLEGAGARGTLELVADEVLGPRAERCRRPRRSPSSARRSRASGLRSRRRSAPSASRSRSSIGSRCGRPRSGRPCSRSCASRGWAASDPSSTRTCARRTPAFRVETSIGSKAVSAGAVCFVATGRSP